MVLRRICACQRGRFCCRPSRQGLPDAGRRTPLATTGSEGERQAKWTWATAQARPCRLRLFHRLLLPFPFVLAVFLRVPPLRRVWASRHGTWLAARHGPLPSHGSPAGARREPTCSKRQRHGRERILQKSTSIGGCRLPSRGLGDGVWMDEGFAVDGSTWQDRPRASCEVGPRARCQVGRRAFGRIWKAQERRSGTRFQGRSIRRVGVRFRGSDREPIPRFSAHVVSFASISASHLLPSAPRQGEGLAPVPFHPIFASRAKTAVLVGRQADGRRLAR